MACYEKGGETMRQSHPNVAANLRFRTDHVRAAAVLADVHEQLEVVICVRNGLIVVVPVNDGSQKSFAPGIMILTTLGAEEFAKLPEPFSPRLIPGRDPP